MTKNRGSIAAAFLTLVFPGLGQAVFGEGRRGAIWAIGVFAAWALPSLLAGLWLGALAVGIVLSVLAWIACAVDAFRHPRKPPSVRGFLELAVAIGLVSTLGPIGVASVIRTTALEAFKIPSGSMCPTLEVGDHIYVDKSAYRKEPIRVGDVVVHRTNDASGREVEFVRRVVAVGGDEVSVDETGHVTRKGRAATLHPAGHRRCGSGPDLSLFDEQLDGERGSHLVGFDSEALGNAAGPVRVPEGELYLMGDNRLNSYDSRVIGPAKVDTVVGRVWRVWLRGSNVTWSEVR